MDRIAPAALKHSAQTLYTLVIFGLGPLASGWLNGRLAVYCGTEGGKLTLEGFGTFWAVAGAIALVAAFVFAAFFRDETVEETEAGTRQG